MNPETTGGTVLIVDDSELARQVIHTLLSRAGFQTAQVAGGEECLAWLEHHAADCVLLDIDMPGQGGLETLRALRRRFPRNRLPVVLLAAHADTERAVEALAQGANDFVAKPAHAGVLIARVESQIALKRAGESRAPERPPGGGAAAAEPAGAGPAADAGAGAGAAGGAGSQAHLLRQVIDTLPHWISVKDRDGRYRIVNRAMAEAHGVPVEDFEGRRAEDARELLLGTVGRIVRLDDQVLETGEPLQMSEYEVRTLAGEPRTRRVAKFPLLGGSGAVEGIVTWSEDITEQRQSEAEVRANRLLLRQIIDAVPQWITVKDPEGRYLMVNRAVADSLAMDVSAFLGRTVGEAFRFPEREMERIEERDRELLDTARPVAGVDVKVRMPDGGIQVRHMIKTPLLDEERNLRGVVTWSEDVTDARQAEDALHSGRRLMRGIIDSLPFWISVTDREGRFRVVNRAMAEALGTTPEALAGRTREVLRPALTLPLDVLQAQDRQVVASAQALESPQVTLTGADGTQRVRRLAKFPLLDDRGQVEGVVSWSEDVTDRLNEEALVERSRRLMAHAEEVAHLGAMEWDLVTGEQFWSDSVYRLIGYEAQEFPATAQAFADVLHPQDKRRVLATMAQAAARGEGVELECRVLHRDGRERIVHARGEIVRDEQGRPQRLIGTVQDITESRKAEEELRRAQRLEALGQLTGSVAHDFNNLLQIVNGYAHMARRRPPGDPLILEDLKEVVAATDRGSTLARQLLAFSRRSAVQRSVLGLNDLVRGLEKMLRVAVGENVTISLELAPDTPLVEADAGMLEQVLVNLAINSRDAMPAGGRLVIRTAATPDPDGAAAGAARVEVCDTGMGIAEEIREHVFDPYFTTKEPTKGTGLGLATVYGIVRQHGGHIELDSTVGRGTTVAITLPAVDVDATPVAEDAPPIAPGGGETILVADNDPTLLRMLEMLLRAKGYRLVSACDGEEAVARVESAGEPVALAVLDIRMPGTDGFEAGRRIRALRPTLPIVYTTGDASLAGLEHLADLPSQYLLHKPFSAEELYAVVRRALDWRTRDAVNPGGTAPPAAGSGGA